MRCLCVRRCATGGLASSSASSPPAAAGSAVHSTLHAFRTRDITLRIPSKDHLLRVSFCSTRYLLAETIRRHNLLRLTNANLPFLQLLGTQLTFTNLLASAQEGEERVETRLTAEEATILTEALALGECRCYLRPEYNAQLEAQGQPTFPLRVNRILYRQRAPFSSLVHADLAELLQSPTTSGAVAGKQATTATASELDVPFSLYSPGMEDRVPLEAWTNFFAYNSTLHAYNYLRRSDGCVPAVWMHSALDSGVLEKDGLVNADGTAANNGAEHQHPGASDGKTAEEAAEALQRTLRHAIPHSFGLVITPLAAGNAVDRQIGHLNRVLAEAAAVLHSPRRAASPLAGLLQRCAEQHTTCQHILSLVTGDHDGAHASAVAARQYSQDPAQVAAAVDPIRRAMGIDGVVIPLAATEAVRTGLDFFCRCSKANIISSLTAAPESALASLKENGSIVSCSFCGREHHLDAADWAEVEKTRGAPPGPGPSA